MRKFCFLTSVLALAACAGGSGENNTAPGEIAYVDVVGESNSRITRMVSNSEYQVARYVANKLGDDTGDMNMSRAGTVRGAFVPSEPTGNIDYDTARELVDIAAWLVNDTTTQSDIVSMFNNSEEDKNKIKSALKLLDDMYCFVGGNAEKTADRILQQRSNFVVPLADLQEKTEVFNLKDVMFKTIPTSGVIGDLRFNVNQQTGRVESIQYMNAEQIMEEHEGSDVPVGPILRDGDTNVFVFSETVTEESSPLFGQSVDIPSEYVSYGRDLGLKYSDFGVLRTDFTTVDFPGVEDFGVHETPFVGGYTTKQVDDNRMKELAQGGDVVFHGLAKGTLSYHDWDAGIPGSTGADVPMPGGLSDENATLTFADDGSQTLAADFTNWAKIEAVKTENDGNQLVVVQSYVDSDSPYYAVTSGTGLSGDMSGEHSMVFETGYYGDNNNPGEAVGLVQYQRQWGDMHYVEAEDRWDMENHLNVDLGFGGTIAE